MLIQLFTSIDVLEAEDRIDMEELFSELLRASYTGSHIVVIDRAACDWCASELSLNSKELAHLNRLKEIHTQTGSLFNIARSSLRVEIGDAHLLECDPHKYKIGHRRLIGGKYLETPKLLVEHIENDGDIFEIVLNAVRRRHPINNYRYERLHGGGADITACFRSEIPNQHIVVGVVDSDKVAPCDTSSATKRNLDREAAKQTFIGMICETPCKEAENYIPLEILKAHKLRICPEFTGFADLESLINSQSHCGASDCMWLYFDLKKGIEPEKLNGIGDPAVVHWLKEKYQLGDGDFRDVEIPGFGEAILRNFLTCGEAVKEYVGYTKGPYWNRHFWDFFDLIYWYFASNPRSRVL